MSWIIRTIGCWVQPAADSSYADRDGDCYRNAYCYRDRHSNRDCHGNGNGHGNGGTLTATPTPVPAPLKVSPNTLHFPTSVFGSPSKPGKVKLLNPRNSKQDSPILIISAVPTTPFSIDTALSTCHVGTALAPKSDCFFFLTYTASALVTQHGTFTIKDDSETAGRAIVNLDGKGKPPRNEFNEWPNRASQNRA